MFSNKKLKNKMFDTYFIDNKINKIINNNKVYISYFIDNKINKICGKLGILMIGYQKEVQ
jgi:hypothetical protein